MGLDMFLMKEIYTKNWEHTPKEERYEITVKRGGKPVDVEPKYLVEEVAYWRKANQIHAWFVRNVQGGEDECNPYYVSLRELEDLLETVRTVLQSITLSEGRIQNGWKIENGERVPVFEDGKFIDDPSVAKRLLPCEEGFLFGSTQYDEWYYADLKYTEEVLEQLIAKHTDDYTYKYQASW